MRWMQCEGITTGFADGTYRKHADISRGQSLAFMHRYLDPEFTAPATSPFRDVEVGSTFYEAITWAAATGVTKGYSDNTFKQYQDVTRAEFAAFVFRAVGDEDFQVPAESPFTDLMPGQTHYQAITWMESEGLLKGYQDGSFGVAKPITRGEVAVIMERVDAMMQEG
ncbi:S-layer homology domain-containing protein [Micrococcus endophyticus]|nr:S-layer homology domain-containing protein [Micrococcus endophyticus]